jgi:glycosyltransferase involved in cell wall biosynthesis
MPDVTAVLTVFDDDARLRFTLEGWARQTVPLSQLVVVNDGGDNEEATKSLVLSYEGRIPEVTYVWFGPSKKEIGKQVFRLAAARNAGLKHAKGTWTIISDCDTVPARNLVSVISAHSRDNRVLIGVRERISKEDFSKMQLSDLDNIASLPYTVDERFINGNWKVLFPAIKDTGGPSAWNLCWGCLFSAKTSHFKELGGFDQRFRSWGAEDLEIAERFEKGKGCKFYALPEAIVYHLDHPPRDPMPYTALDTYYKIRENWNPVANGGPILP